MKGKEQLRSVVTGDRHLSIRDDIFLGAQRIRNDIKQSAQAMKESAQGPSSTTTILG